MGMRRSATRAGAAGRAHGRRLRSHTRTAMLSLVAIGLMPGAATAGVDDYPAYLRNAAQDSLFDPWLFYNRECTSFVAWRLNSRNGVAFRNWYGGPRWGNANTWDDAARSVGIPVNGTPAVGAIAQRDAGSGHVAWVEAVNGNGTVTIEDYNSDFRGHYSERSVATSSFVYIHVKDIGGGGPNLGEGAFVQVAGHSEVYRMAGGAPVYVSSLGRGRRAAAGVGGQPAAVRRPRPYPADGTLISNSTDGRVYVVAGGAPLYVSNWGAIGGPRGVTTVDKWAIDNPENPLAHLRRHPVDGTLISNSTDGRVYVVAGVLRCT